MKTITQCEISSYLSVIFQLSTLAAAPRDDQRTIVCVGAAIVSLGLEGVVGGAQVIAEIWRTVDELLEGRRRCMEMTNDARREACLAAWTIGAIADLLRLRNLVAEVTSEEIAQQFFDDMINCFGIDPDHPYEETQRKLF
jgi:hypothetical protein